MSRRATIRTTHENADLVARALRPDNTDEMETTVESSTAADNGHSDGDTGTVVTRIERETTGGLHSNVDDYVVNLEVAMDVTRQANAGHSARDGQDDKPMDAGTASDTNDDTINNE